MNDIQKFIGLFLLGLSVGITIGTVRSGAGIRRTRGDVAELRSDFGGIEQLAQQSDDRVERSLAVGSELDEGLADVEERSRDATDELTERVIDVTRTGDGISRGVGEASDRHGRIVSVVGELFATVDALRERSNAPR